MSMLREAWCSSAYAGCSAYGSYLLHTAFKLSSILDSRVSCCQANDLSMQQMLSFSVASTCSRDL